jgi:iron(III) transport system permease protein
MRKRERIRVVQRSVEDSTMSVPTAIEPDGPSRRRAPIRARSRRRTGRWFSGPELIKVPAVLVLLYLVLGPIVMLILASLEDTSRGVTVRSPIPWSLGNFHDVFADSKTYSVLFTTLVFAGSCLLLSFVIGLALSWLVERTDMPGRGLIFVLVVAPTGIPGLISAIAWSLLINPTNGYLNVIIRDAFDLGGRGPFNAYSLPAMIFVQGLALVPLTFLLITASMRGMSTSLEEAARASGAPPWRVVRKVTLPLLRPVLLGAAVYQFVNVIEAVDVPLTLGLPGHVTVFSTQVYRVTHPSFGLPNYGASSAYGILLLLLALAPLLFYNRIVRRSKDFATVGGKAFRPRVQKLGRWRWVAFTGAMIYILVSFILPLLVLLIASLEPYVGALSWSRIRHVTFDSYGETLSSDLFRSSLIHTLVIGVAASALAMALSLVLSWIIVRSRSRWAWMTDVLAFVPHAIPGVVIGLAVLLLYLLLPIPLYGTIWIIVVAMATQYVSLGTRLTSGGITQIQEGLEEAAQASGAGAARVWRHVLLPLMRPVLLNGFLLVFLATIKNLTLPLILQSSDNVVMSTLIWNRWDYGDVSGAAVLSVVLTAVTVTAAVALRRLSGSSLDS